ncbi:MAG: beta-N-acetylglucosaminidase domain-containing protein [candidate division WOR-3 bacterium]
MPDKYFGVVEGFYRRPYTFSQRLNLINFLSELKLNTYVYAPKSDPYHRREYYKPYPTERIKEFASLNNRAEEKKIIFNYALSPGPKPESKLIIKKIKQLVHAGIKHFSILYDDIKIELNKENARIQTDSANELYVFLKEQFNNTTLFFCPTQYCGLKESEYIFYIAENLHPEIEIFWTGKNVVSKRITEIQVNRISAIYKRAPLIWDNIFANDYIPGVIWKFPYRNREPEIVEKVSGILINPMNQYQQSKPLIFTAAKFFSAPFNYSPKKVLQEARHLLS